MIPRFRALTALLAALGAARAQLDPATMTQHLTNGAGILGNFSTAGSLTDWLAVFDDSTPLVSMNLPGTHDTAAWNIAGIEGSLLQCQDYAIFDQLNAGIRFFDLRFGSNNGTLQVYHADFLLDQKATLEDVLWGFYHFLDAHPTETVILSLKVDHGDTDAALQSAVHDMLTTPPVSDYWLLDAQPGTLGAARHKAVLFRRFTFDGALPFGIDVSTGWANNEADFDVGGNAWVEDLYELDLATQQDVISGKFAAVQAHLAAAQAPANASELFVTFASAGGATPQGYATPRIVAEGNGNATGVNALLLPTLGTNGSRIGVVMLDFFHSPENLVYSVIGSTNVRPNASTLAAPTGTAAAPGTTASHTGAAAGRQAGAWAALIAGCALAVVML